MPATAQRTLSNWHKGLDADAPISTVIANVDHCGWPAAIGAKRLISGRKAGDPKPFARGINSTQLCSDGKRWWIVTVSWQPESLDNQLPSQYLRSP